MDSKSLTICIKGSNIQSVKEVISGNAFLTNIFSTSELMLSIDDYEQEFIYTREFLKERNLEDETPFFNDFDIAPFNTLLDVTVSNRFKHLDILEVIIFELAQYLSKSLQTQCIALYEDMEIPVGLFTNGKLEQNFYGYNQSFFAMKNWCPKLIPLTL